jgi:hypothetical protein
MLPEVRHPNCVFWRLYWGSVGSVRGILYRQSYNIDCGPVDVEQIADMVEIVRVIVPDDCDLEVASVRYQAIQDPGP